MKPEDKAKIQQALDVIETPIHEQPFMAKQKAIAALRQLLEAEAEQEPATKEAQLHAMKNELWRTPPAQPAVPLTDEQRSKMYRTAVLRGDNIMVRSDYELGISDTEAAHGITATPTEGE
jgi:hypothetical protein